VDSSSVIRRYLDYLRQPKQLVAMPFRLVVMAAALYLLFGGSPWYGEPTHDVTLVMIGAIVATLVIDVAWWAVCRYRGRRDSAPRRA
jgi:hypothetical protein